MAVESRLQLQPYDDVVRYYVDGTNGLDGALGTSWATAWKTLAHTMRELSRLLSSLPNGLTIIVRLRGTFGATDHLVGLLPVSGTSSVVLSCDYSDSTILATGTVTAVGGEAPVPLHGLIRMTLGGGLVVATSHLGKWIRFDEGVGLRKATYQIVRVDTVNNYVWLSERIADFAAWVAGGTVVTVFESGAILEGAIELSGPCPDRSATTSATRALALFNIRTYKAARLKGILGLVFAIDARNAGGTAQTVRVYECENASRVSHSVVSTAILDELGFSSGASNKMFAGCVAGLSYFSGGVGYVTGYFTAGIRVMGGSWQFNYCSAQYYEGYQSDGSGVFNCIARGGGTYAPLTSQSNSQLSASGVSILDLPAAGHTVNGLVQARNGGDVSCSDVEGNNTGTGVTLYGVTSVDPGSRVRLDAVSAASLKGEHGNVRASGGGLVEVDGAATIGSSEGGGPDFYVEGASFLLFKGAVTKSATNSSSGGVAQPVLQVRRGAKVVQAAGSAFTLPAGSGNNTTDYGANGAIDIETCCDVALGTLAGGNAVATNTAVRVKRASRLAHAGAAPTWGAAALDQGGNAAAAMPAAVTSDMAAGVPEDCWVLPNSA